MNELISVFATLYAYMVLSYGLGFYSGLLTTPNGHEEL